MAGEVLETWAIVVAGGSGERLGADRPKAFVRLAGRTLVAASLAVLDDHPGIDGIVCVVPEGWEERATLIADDLCATKIAAMVPGGASRAESVAAGVECLPPRATFVLVHDAARPLLAPALVDRVMGALAEGAEGVVPALPVTDTVKLLGADGTVAQTLPRERLVAVQTPQGFPVEVLRAAIAAAGDSLSGATDCASLVEAAGRRVVTVAGDPGNVKVTTSADLARVEAVLGVGDGDGEEDGE